LRVTIGGGGDVGSAVGLDVEVTVEASSVTLAVGFTVGLVDAGAAVGLAVSKSLSISSISVPRLEMKWVLV
jgi:hypothetical protein